MHKQNNYNRPFTQFGKDAMHNLRGFSVWCNTSHRNTEPYSRPAPIGQDDRLWRNHKL